MCVCVESDSKVIPKWYPKNFKFSERMKICLERDPRIWYDLCRFLSVWGCVWVALDLRIPRDSPRVVGPSALPVGCPKIPIDFQDLLGDPLCPRTF